MQHLLLLFSNWIEILDMKDKDVDLLIIYYLLQSVLHSFTSVTLIQALN